LGSFLQDAEASATLLLATNTAR